MNFIHPDWCGLQWTQWVSFNDPKSFKLLPPDAGIYRVRAVEGKELFYLGQTGRNLLTNQAPKFQFIGYR